MGAPATLPAGFFDKQPPSSLPADQLPDTLPADFNFSSSAPAPASALPTIRSFSDLDALHRATNPSPSLRPLPSFIPRRTDIPFYSLPTQQQQFDSEKRRRPAYPSPPTSAVIQPVRSIRQDMEESAGAGGPEGGPAYSLQPEDWQKPSLPFTQFPLIPSSSGMKSTEEWTRIHPDDPTGHALHGLAQVAEGLTTPENLAIIGATGGLGLAGAGARIAGPAISGYFTYQMGKGLVDEGQNYLDALNRGDVGAAQESSIRMMANAFMMRQAGSHTVEGSRAVGDSLSNWMDRTRTAWEENRRARVAQRDLMGQPLVDQPQPFSPTPESQSVYGQWGRPYGLPPAMGSPTGFPERISATPAQTRTAELSKQFGPPTGTPPVAPAPTPTAPVAPPATTQESFSTPDVAGRASTPPTPENTYTPPPSPSPSPTPPPPLSQPEATPTTPAVVPPSATPTPSGESAAKRIGESGIDVIRGSSAVPLSPQGIEEANNLAQRTSGQFTKIFTSDLGRAQQTADAVSATNPQAGPPTQVEALTPWYLGGFEGQPTDKVIGEVNHLITSTPDAIPPGQGDLSTRPGQSFNEFKNTLLTHLQDEIASLQPGDKVLNVTHYRDIRAVESWLRAGANPDNSIDLQHMTERGNEVPGELFRLDLAKKELTPVMTADEPGIYFARHGATEFNGENRPLAPETPPALTPSTPPVPPAPPAASPPAPTERTPLGLNTSESGSIPLGEIADYLRSPDFKRDLLEISTLGTRTPSPLSPGPVFNMVSEARTAAADFASRISKPSRDYIQGLVSPAFAKLYASSKLLDDLHTHMGRMNIAKAQLQTTVAEYGFRDLFSRLSPVDHISFNDRMRRGAPQPTPELQSAAHFIKSITDQLWNEASKVVTWLPYNERFGLPIRWKVPPKSENFDPTTGDYLGKRDAQGNFRGPGNFTKDRYWQIIQDGLNHGGVLESTNPIDLLNTYANSVYRFVSAQRVWDDMVKDGRAKWVEGRNAPAPPGLVPLAADVAKSYFTPEGKSSYSNGYWAVESGTAGILKNFLSKDWFRNPSGSPIASFPWALAMTGRGLIGLKNLYTRFELGLSAFHPMLVSFESVNSAFGLGVRKILNSPHDIPGGIADIARAMTIAPAIARATLAGRTATQIFSEISKRSSSLESGPGAGELGAMRPLSSATSTPEVLADPRFSKFSRKYPNAIPLIDDWFTGGGVLGMHQDYQTQFTRGLTDAYHQAKLGIADMDMGLAGKKLATMMLDSLPAATEITSRPIFEYYIPYLKLGTFLQEFPRALDENAGRLARGEVTRTALARQTVSFIEDRFGEMNFDNLFMDRGFKTMLQIAIRSVTWQLGSWRAVAGSPVEQSKYLARRAKFLTAGEGAGASAGEGAAGAAGTPPPFLSPKAAWLAGAILTTAVNGSILHYLTTGLLPGRDESNNDLGTVQYLKDTIGSGGMVGLFRAAGMTARDFAYPQHDPADPSRRLVMPGIANIKVVSHGLKEPAKYFGSSMSGIWGKMWEAATNSDYANRQVYDPDAPWLQQRISQAAHLLPRTISISSGLRAYQSGETIPSAIIQGLGFIQRAPRYAYQSPAMTEAESLAPRSLDAEDAAIVDKRRMKREIATALVAGREDAAVRIASRGLSDGTITSNDLANPADLQKALIRADPTSRLVDAVKRLSIDAGLRVYAKGSPAEKSALEETIWDKTVRKLSRGELSPREAEKLKTIAGKSGYANLVTLLTELGPSIPSSTSLGSPTP